MADQERLIQSSNGDAGSRNGSNGNDSGSTGNDSGSTGKAERTPTERTSNGPSQKYRKHKLNIDFVLAAKNVSKDSMNAAEKEKDKRRRKYFHNLKKKRLQISRRQVSHVSMTYVC